MSNIFIHWHLYYLEQTDMLLKKLSTAIPGNKCDLFVTMHENRPQTKQKIKSVFPNAKIIILKNIGADVWPFVYVLGLIDLHNYDYIIKVHTKRNIADKIYLKNGFFCRGDRWRNNLLSFLEPRNFDKSLAAFASDKKLGMVADFRVILRNYNRDKPTTEKTKKFMRGIGVSDRIEFPAGTMFMARARLFDIVKKADIRESDFQKFRSGISAQFSHTMEQFLGSCVVAQGYTIRDPFTPRWYRYLFTALAQFWKVARKISSFLWCDYREKDGTRKIAIFFITFYTKKTKKTAVTEK
jgi:lipopolysaccharide biosynthesis protein